MSNEQEVQEFAAALEAAERSDEWEGDMFERMAQGMIAAGYVKADHIEYAADHKHAGIDHADEDGDLWTDRDDFEDYYEDYRDSCKRVQRHVTKWEPLS